MALGSSRLLKPALALLAAQSVAVGVYLGVERGRAGAQRAFTHQILPAANPAPPLTLTPNHGAPREWAHLRGEAVLLHFWASGCIPCREELPALLELGRELSRERRLEVIAVSLDEDWEAVRAFFGGQVPPEVVQDLGGQSARAYAVSALPDSYLVSPQGALWLRFKGARDWRSSAARELLERHAPVR